MKINPVSQIGYKVVRQRNEELLSVTKELDKLGLSVAYDRYGGLVKPKLGKLFVFKTLVDATEYQKSIGKEYVFESQIWQVQCFGSYAPKSRDILRVWMPREQTDFAEFWQAIADESQLYKFDIGYMPAQTFWCGSLRMKKKIE